MDAAAINTVLRAGAALAFAGAIGAAGVRPRTCVTRPSAGALRRPRRPLALNATTFCLCSPRPVDAERHDVARLQPLRRLHAQRHARRRAGRDHVARQQRHVARHVGRRASRRRRSSSSCCPVCRRSPLTSSHMSRFCGSLISSGVTSQGPMRTERVAALALAPLRRALLHLELALRHVVDQAIAGDVTQRVLLVDVAAPCGRSRRRARPPSRAASNCAAPSRCRWGRRCTSAT